MTPFPEDFTQPLILLVCVTNFMERKTDLKASSLFQRWSHEILVSSRGSETPKGRKPIQLGCINEQGIGIGTWGALLPWKTA